MSSAAAPIFQPAPGQPSTSLSRSITAITDSQLRVFRRSGRLTVWRSMRPRAMISTTSSSSSGASGDSRRQRMPWPGSVGP